MSAVAMLDLGTRTLHLPSTTHGVAHCGADLRSAGPWACGPTPVLGRVARWRCMQCYADSHGGLMYRLSHCSDCDCAHERPEPGCACVCHDEVPDGG